MSKRVYGVDLDLGGNALLNAVLQVLASAPANATTAGRMWFNSADKTIHIGDGTNDISIPTSAGTSYTDEQAVDAVAAALTNGANITITYNDPGNTITIALSGTVTHAFISDFDAQVRTSRLDQMATPTADVAFGGHKATGLADGTANTDAATYGQVLSLFQGRVEKAAVRAVSTTNIAVASGIVNGATIGGVTVATGDRVALVGQTAGAENGIYVVVASGAASRATDMDTGAEASNAFFWVGEGTNADTGWKVMNDGTITLGTTALVISKVIEASTYTFGTGLSKSGATVSVDHTKVPFIATATIGDGSSTSIDVVHNLGTRFVDVTVYAHASTYDEIDCGVQHKDNNTVTLLFNTAPASNAYDVVILG